MTTRFSITTKKTLDEWLAWMETSHTKEIDLGLERVTKVKDNLQIKFPKQTVITIAGTNGKGSCVQVLEQLLVSNNITCVSFTSPHFLKYNERIRYNGENICDKDLVAIFEHIDQKRGDISLSYFEFAALAAMEYAKRKQPEFVILEVGLGGRLDAVNCIDADIAIVTSIGIDHEAWLGSDKEVIATEKCGIFRENAWAISGDLNPPKNIANSAKLHKAKLLQHQRDFSFYQQSNGSHVFKGLDTQGFTIELDLLELPQLPLNSIACALQALLLSPLDLQNFSFANLAETQLTGRWQQLKYLDKSFILDVAHNPEAANLLASNLAVKPVEGKSFAIFAVMADKDIMSIVKPLMGSFDQWILINLRDNPRAAHNREVFDIICDIDESAKARLNNIDDIDSALNFLNKHMQPKDRCVVFGSFFTVTEFLNNL